MTGPETEEPIEERELRLSFPATSLHVRDALQVATAELRFAGLGGETGEEIELVLAEALNNVVEHAYGDTGGRIDLHIRQSPVHIECEVIDCGRAFPPGELPGAALPSSALNPQQVDDLPEGGFGWFLIRSLTRHLSYDRQDARNTLQFSLDVKRQIYTGDPVDG